MRFIRMVLALKEYEGLEYMSEGKESCYLERT